ncbi:MAG: flagellar hook-length control protein FliK, partial [Alphaproteobacteria bacterium]|nr:flagellar hook-length control protein FliK [Alphaproteobacteria bacterium]
ILSRIQTDSEGRAQADGQGAEGAVVQLVPDASHRQNVALSLVQEKEDDEQGESDPLAVLYGDLLATSLSNDPAAVPQEESFLEAVTSLFRGLPVESRPQVVALPPGAVRETIARFLEESKDTITTSADAGAASPLLIATGKTPEDLRTFFDQIVHETKTGKTYIAGLVKLLPPEADRATVFAPGILILPTVQKTGAPLKGTRPAETLSGAEGTSLPSSGGAEAAKAGPSAGHDFFSVGQLNALLGGGDSAFSAAEESEESLPRGFERILKILETAQQKGNAFAGSEKSENAGQGKLSPGLSAIPAQAGFLSPAGAQGLWTEGGDWDSLFPDGAHWRADGGAAPGTMLTTSSLTSLSTHVAQAGQLHPATQTIAATVQKAAGSGENKALTLDLDPPDLGRVRVRLEFGKDKTMKAHLLVEKQETWLMLQRDAHQLERALQGSGLDTDQGGLSFELAQDGNLFGQNGDGRGNQGEYYGGASRGDGEDNAVDIIQASVNWSIDPETGLTRYDLLV